MTGAFSKSNVYCQFRVTLSLQCLHCKLQKGFIRVSLFINTSHGSLYFVNKIIPSKKMGSGSRHQRKYKGQLSPKQVFGKYPSLYFVFSPVSTYLYHSLTYNLAVECKAAGFLRILHAYLSAVREQSCIVLRELQIL